MKNNTLKNLLLMKQFLLLLFFGVISFTAGAQVTVSGVVTDAMNEPLPGITVVL